MYEVVASVFRVEELHGSDSPQGSSLCVCVCWGVLLQFLFFFPSPPAVSTSENLSAPVQHAVFCD